MNNLNIKIIFIIGVVLASLICTTLEHITCNSKKHVVEARSKVKTLDFAINDIPSESKRLCVRDSFIDAYFKRLEVAEKLDICQSKNIELMEELLTERKILVVMSNNMSQMHSNMCQMQNNITILNTALVNSERYLNILVVRTRIRHLERYLLPAGNNPRSRYELWVRILNSGDPEANQVLQRVLEEYKSNDVDWSISKFAKALQDICGDLSDEGVYNVVDHNVLYKLSNGDDKEARLILKVLRIRFDETYVKALRVVSKPLTIPNDTVGSEDKYKQFTCVVIQPAKGRFNNQKPITIEEVKEFFPLNEPKSVIINTDDKYANQEVIAEFSSNSVAVEAYNNNHGWLNKIKVKTGLSRRKETTPDV